MIKDIEQANGYLIDADGKVIQRFANWERGHHEVHAATDNIEYVSGPSAHEKPVHDDYKPDR